MGKAQKPGGITQPLPAFAEGELLSLATAARFAYAGATGSHTNDLETLNNVARLIAACTRIFTLNADETARPVSVATLANGCFEDGGDSLRVKDSQRAPISALAIRRVELGTVMDAIRKVYGRSAS